MNYHVYKVAADGQTYEADLLALQDRRATLGTRLLEIDVRADERSSWLFDEEFGELERSRQERNASPFANLQARMEGIKRGLEKCKTCT